MRQLSLFIFAVLLLGITHARERMHVKAYNFSSFSTEIKNITPELKKNTPKELQSHPEFGIKPFKSQCIDCVELIHRRDFYSRYFIDPNTSTHFFVQKSYTPLHYWEDGTLQTIDPRLKPSEVTSGMYEANHQPIKTQYDFNKKIATIKVRDFSFEFNKHLTLSYVDKAGNQTKKSPLDFSASTIGEEGVFVKSGWEHIDIQQVFKESGVKTNYVINQPLDIPIKEGWLVFEDTYELPEGYVLNGKSINEEGFWAGDAFIKNSRGERIINFKRPFYYDATSKGLNGFYSATITGSEVVLQVMVPVSWLNNDLQYPVTIDPWVSGRDSIGFFGYTSPGGLPIAGGGPFGFTEFSIGSCDTMLNVTVPGKSELFGAYIDLEYENSDSICRKPVDTSNFCSFGHVSMQIEGPCEITDTLKCNEAVNPWRGTCTTDPNKVSGAGPIYFPTFAACIPPQCPDYNLSFALKNRTYKCLETCNTKCAIGHFFAITIEGRTLEGTVQAQTSDGTVITPLDTFCAREPVRLIAFPVYGVPPYNDYWLPGALTDSVVEFVYPQQTTTYIDTLEDFCGNSWLDSVTINIKPTPILNVAETIEKCEDDPPFSIGTPVQPPGTTIQWSASQPSDLNFLSSTTDPNPMVAIPSGYTGTITYVVEVANLVCSSYDTVVINVAANPDPVILADTLEIQCASDEVTLFTSTSYPDYVWSTTAITDSITTNQSGNYTVAVVDSNGCSGTDSYNLTIETPVVLNFQILPGNVEIDSGDIVTLVPTIDLTDNTIVNSYTWSPDTSISCTNCPNPDVDPLTTQTYVLSALSVDSCETIKSITITVKMDTAVTDTTTPDTTIITPPDTTIIVTPDYVIPSGFSPNDDGINDEFFIVEISNVSVIEFKIFNRWGEMIHNATIPWQGFHKDELQPIGSYTYLIVVELSDGSRVTENGTITLIR